MPYLCTRKHCKEVMNKQQTLTKNKYIMKRLILTISILCSLTVMNAQSISRPQASADIDTLLFTLSEVHPNLYSKITENNLNGLIADLKANIQDSTSVIELYKGLAPIIAQIGDAHTTMVLPYREVMINAGRYIPIFPTIDCNTGKMLVKASVGNCIPYDSEIISINGMSAKEMVDKMLAFVGGEREFYRLTMVDNNIMGLFHMLFAAPEYDIKFVAPNTPTPPSGAGELSLQAVEADKLNSGLVLSPKILKLMEEHGGNAPYTFRIIADKKIAVMNFDACMDVNGMQAFADSMFTTLHQQGIYNLIIDVRYNGGGNSAVGDVLLKYIAPKPFAQYGKTLVKVTPKTIALTGNRYEKPDTIIYPETPASRHEPLPESKRFHGNVYLLTSHTTFSSASSFAWAFKEAGCGMVIGEETGGMNVHYGDVISFRLPNSGLAVNVSHKRFWLPGADENNIHGVIPDIICHQDNALTTALNCIDKENDNE